MVTACRRGGERPYLQRRRCLFGHSAEVQVAAALLVGGEAPSVDVLELAADVQRLRRVVQRLAGTIMWDRANPPATAVAKYAVEARPPEVARGETLTETVCANAADATVGDLLVKLGLLGSHNLKSKGPLVKLGVLGLEQRENPAPALQQSQCLLVELGLRESQSRVPRRNLNSQSVLVKLAAPRQSQHSKSPLVMLGPQVPEPVAPPL